MYALDGIIGRVNIDRRGGCIDIEPRSGRLHIITLSEVRFGARCAALLPDDPEFKVVSMLGELLNVEVKLIHIHDDPDILFVSVFATEDQTKEVLRNTPRAFRISFSSEVRDHTHFPKELLDLALGFHCPQGGRIPCVRFPLWITRIATSSCTIQGSFFRYQSITSEAWASSPCFASLISRHGGFPRQELFDELSQLGFVEAPGVFIHNTNFSSSYPEGSLDEKLDFLSRCRYNICPENIRAGGYVTEKVFEAAWSGNIPVYWGETNPEPRILNSERILNLAPSDDIAGLIDRVRQLENDPRARARLFSTPPFVLGAQDYVSEMCDEYIRHVLRRFFFKSKKGPGKIAKR